MSSASALYSSVKEQTHELLRLLESRAESPGSAPAPAPAAADASEASCLLQSSRELARAMGNLGKEEDLRATVLALQGDNSKMQGDRSKSVEK